MQHRHIDNLLLNIRSNSRGTKLSSPIKARQCFGAIQGGPTKATKAAKQIPSGIQSETSYTPEDGHVGRNM
jgi:hypothetical protein